MGQHHISSTNMHKFSAFIFLLIVCSQSVAIRDGNRGSSGYERNTMHTQMNKNSFGSIPRRKLLSCPDYNPYLKISVDPPGPLKDVHELNITISGVQTPLVSDWIAILSPYSVK